MNVLAACPDGAAAMQAIRKLKPDVAVLDLMMPGFTDLDALMCIVAEGYPTKVVFLTATATDAQLLDAVASGAVAIVLKEEALEHLVRCIMAVAAGYRWFPSHLIDAARKRETDRSSMSLRLTHLLTARERQVILKVAEGFSNKEAAHQLSLCEGTIKLHLHNIYKKLGLTNRTALTGLAIAYRDQLSAVRSARQQKFLKCAIQGAKCPSPPIPFQP
jgi:DNA-binding NarL/FixJ family response regulator